MCTLHVGCCFRCCVCNAMCEIVFQCVGRSLAIFVLWCFNLLCTCGPLSREQRGVVVLLCAFHLKSSLELCFIIFCGLCEENHKAKKLEALCHNYLPKFLVLMVCLSMGSSFLNTFQGGYIKSTPNKYPQRMHYRDNTLQRLQNPTL